MANNDFEIADVTDYAVEDGEIRLDIGDTISGESYATDCQFWGTDGFYAIPAAADADGAAQALFFMDGNSKRVVGTRDNRTVEKYGQLKAGDRAIISTGDARLVLKNDQNAITMYTESGPPGNRDAVMVDIRGSEQRGTVTVKCGSAAFTMEDSGIGLPPTISLTNGVGGIVIDQLGNVTITGLSVRVAGTTVVLGNAAAVPIPAVSSVIYGPSGVTGAPSSSVFVSP